MAKIMPIIMPKITLHARVQDVMTKLKFAAGIFTDQRTKSAAAGCSRNCNDQNRACMSRDDSAPA